VTGAGAGCPEQARSSRVSARKEYGDTPHEPGNIRRRPLCEDRESRFERRRLTTVYSIQERTRAIAPHDRIWKHWSVWPAALRERRKEVKSVRLLLDGVLPPLQIGIPYCAIHVNGRFFNALVQF
jgi:hypothetical protein